MADITQHCELLPGDASQAICHLSQPSEDESKQLGS